MQNEANWRDSGHLKHAESNVHTLGNGLKRWIHQRVGLVSILFLCGCGQGSYTSSYSYHNDSSVNGHRTVVRKHDGLTRRLETTTDVQIQDGRITTFPKAALVKIQETGGTTSREGELRESEGRLELWIKEKEGFRKGSTNDQAWFDGFLSDVMVQ